ncbi:class I SAM-dependent methyltransferase [Brachybacterium sp. AOP43-C2-M15]|uniref:class I SAM-dependent methyltransferase n=1 Tax=Brachybacterium sp. AOP43-C2-M15 TaxID=3457661 RepID=UPI0040338D7C
MDPAELWSTGDYAVVGDLWSAPGRDLAASTGVAGLDAIDLATGTGVTAIALAQHGARSVTGVDITSSLLDVARRRAEEAGVRPRWVLGDIEAVPLESGSADLVTSTFGLVFAANPGVAIGEARRVTRPGGRILVTSWSGEGFFGALRRTLAPYFPETPAPWHEDPARIREITGADATVEERTFDLRVPSPEVFIDLLQRHSAPIILGSRAIGQRWPEARGRLVELARSSGAADGDSFRIPVQYLVTTIRR